jgi:hypothetical protein
MTAHRLSTTVTVAGGLVACAMVAAPTAAADSLDNIKDAVAKDRAAAHCAALNYNPVLEQAAQTYARSEVPGDGKPAGYNGLVFPVLGSGDPQAAAINSAYQRGAGDAISSCRYAEFGVGFLRHEDRKVDVVTIVFATPGPPPPDNTPVDIGQPVLAPDNGPQPGPVHPAPPPTHTVTGDVDLYDQPGGNGNVIGQLDANDVVTLNGPCPMQNPNNPEDATNGWCLVTDTTKNVTGAVWGDYISK